MSIVDGIIGVFADCWIDKDIRGEFWVGGFESERGGGCYYGKDALWCEEKFTVVIEDIQRRKRTWRRGVWNGYRRGGYKEKFIAE